VASLASTDQSIGVPAERLFEVGRETFRLHFDRSSFEFQHRLADHPLFELPRLMKLAEKTAQTRPDDLYYDSGDVRVDQRWDQTPRGSFSIIEVMERIEHSGAWIILHKAHLDPDYNVVLRKCMAELEDLIGVNLDRVMRVQEIILFVTSPKRITAYHIDRECNFLLQIRGSKTMSVFDPNDRVVLSEEELERFWSVDNNAAIYKPEYQDRARVYRMTPGTVVHLPVNAPHWVRNDDNVSVSVSINFQFRDHIRGNVYRANYAIRRLGLQPTPPGQSKIADALKSYLVVPAVWTKRALNRLSENRR
jgi:hypothetical protein